eukprot:1196588-Rhodomonas_salina.3
MSSLWISASPGQASTLFRRRDHARSQRRLRTCGCENGVRGRDEGAGKAKGGTETICAIESTAACTIHSRWMPLAGAEARSVGEEKGKERCVITLRQRRRSRGDAPSSCTPRSSCLTA